MRRQLPRLFGVGLAAALLLSLFFMQQDRLASMVELYLDDVLYLSWEHMGLVAVSGGLAILVGVPLGMLLSRSFMAKFTSSVMQVLNIGATMPTLAILALSMSFLGIGKVPTLFALWLMTLLPIVRNTYAGMKSVSAHLIEAATGMGMRPLYILLRVELPNSLLVIFAGIRTAIAINIGTAPLAFLIGGGGLGELIFTGIDMNEIDMMLSGAIPVAVLAVMVDFTFGQIQYWFIPRGVNPLRS